MIQDNSTYTDLILQRAEILIGNWKAHLSGDKEIQETYSLDYLSANLVEQIQRINRLKLSNEKADELWLTYSSLFEKNKFTLLCNAIKGAEPVSMLSLFENSLDSLRWSVESDNSPDLDFELADQLTDCLIKRDDLFLIETYVQKYLNDFEKEGSKTIHGLFGQFIEELSKVDKSLKENIEVFALTEKFCREYASSNRLVDGEAYWWIFEPIRRAREIGSISLMSLKPLLSDVKTNEGIRDLTASVNANVQYRRWLLDEQTENKKLDIENLSTLVHLPLNSIGEGQNKYEYALAAKSGVPKQLSNGVYVLTIHKKTKATEHHWLKSTLGVQQHSNAYFDSDIIKIVNDTVPTIALTKYKIPKNAFSIDLHTSTEGCSGKSIGLAVLLEYLRITNYLQDIDTPLAVSGEIELNGGVLPVEDVEMKVQHALTLGFPLIIVPFGNREQLSEDIKNNSAIKWVSTVDEAVQLIEFYGKEEIKPEETSLKLLLRWSSIFKGNGYETSKPKTDKWSDSITVTGYGDKVQLIVDRKKSGIVGKPRLQGNAQTRIYKEISKLLNAEADSGNISISNHAVSGKMIILNDETRKHLQSFLTANFGEFIQEKAEDNCSYRFDIGNESKIVIRQYTNGTLYVRGLTGDFWNNVQSAIESISKQKLAVSTAEISRSGDSQNDLPADVLTWIGVDEAGKGDYFGPLVTAAVLIDESNREQLSSIGIRDSKTLSDQRNIELGTDIAKICGDKSYVLTTMPEKYNQLLTASFKGNSQNMLGWQHRRAMENILLKYDCEWAICDQFGKESFINEGLKTGRGAKINILQRPKAESNLAVAAASILARREFLIRLVKMNEEYQVTFPKGASDTKTIISVAQSLIKRRGEDVLAKVAKTHFKTTKLILNAISSK